jgi:hypothetical protein
MSRVTEFQSGVARQVSSTLPLWLRVGFWACIVIAVAVVIRRLFALVYPPHSAPPQLAALDKAFASHAALTLAHILPALAFVLITPFFIFRKSNETAWPEHVLFPLGLVVGITAYAMSSFSVGRLGGAVRGSAVQHSFLIFSSSRLPLYEARQVAAEEAMADSSDSRPAWHRGHPSCNGNLFCDQSSHTSPAEPVLRHCFLDWLLNEHFDWRGVAQGSATKRC